MKIITTGIVISMLLSSALTTDTEALTNPFTALRNKVSEVKENINNKKNSKDESSVAYSVFQLSSSERKSILNNLTEFSKSLQNVQKGLEKAKDDIRKQSVDIKTFDYSRSSVVGALSIELVVTDLIEKIKILIVLNDTLKSGIQSIEKSKQNGDKNLVAGLQQFRLAKDLASIIPLMVAICKAVIALWGKFALYNGKDMSNSGKIASILSTFTKLIEENVTKKLLKSKKKGFSDVAENWSDDIEKLRTNVNDQEIKQILDNNTESFKEAAEFFDLIPKVFEAGINYAKGSTDSLKGLSSECEKSLGNGNVQKALNYGSNSRQLRQSNGYNNSNRGPIIEEPDDEGNYGGYQSNTRNNNGNRGNLAIKYDGNNNSYNRNDQNLQGNNLRRMNNTGSMESTNRMSNNQLALPNNNLGRGRPQQFN